MGTSGWLATILDQEMLEGDSGSSISPRGTPLAALPRKSGSALSTELGGRYLIHYLRSHQVGRYAGGRGGIVFTTPTAYAPEEAVHYLALPAPKEPPPYAILLDPVHLNDVCGPRWVALGPGIEYVLLGGFSSSAVVRPPGATSGWELLVV